MSVPSPCWDRKNLYKSEIGPRLDETSKRAFYKDFVNMCLIINYF